MAIDDQLAVLLAQNADLFATYEEWANGQIMLLAGTVDDPNSFNESGGKTGALGYYPVINVSGQTIYVACVARLKAIALGGANADVLEGLLAQVGGKLTAVDQSITAANAKIGQTEAARSATVTATAAAEAKTAQAEQARAAAQAIADSSAPLLAARDQAVASAASVLSARVGFGELYGKATWGREAFNGASIVTTDGVPSGFTIPVNAGGETTYVRPTLTIPTLPIGTTIKVETIALVDAGFIAAKTLLPNPLGVTYNDNTSANVGTLTRSEQIGLYLYRDATYVIAGNERNIGTALQVGVSKSKTEAHSLRVTSTTIIVEKLPDGTAASGSDLAIEQRLNGRAAPIEANVATALLNKLGTGEQLRRSSILAAALNGASTGATAGGSPSILTIPSAVTGANSTLYPFLDFAAEVGARYAGSTIRLVTSVSLTPGFIVAKPFTAAAAQVEYRDGTAASPNVGTLVRNEVIDNVLYREVELTLAARVYRAGTVLQIAGNATAGADHSAVLLSASVVCTGVPVGAAYSAGDVTAALRGLDVVRTMGSTRDDLQWSVANAGGATVRTTNGASRGLTIPTGRDGLTSYVMGQLYLAAAWRDLLAGSVVEVRVPVTHSATFTRTLSPELRKNGVTILSRTNGDMLQLSPTERVYIYRFAAAGFVGTDTTLDAYVRVLAGGATATDEFYELGEITFSVIGTTSSTMSVQQINDAIAFARGRTVISSGNLMRLLGTVNNTIYAPMGPGMVGRLDSAGFVTGWTVPVGVAPTATLVQPRLAFDGARNIGRRIKMTIACDTAANLARLPTLAFQVNTAAAAGIVRSFQVTRTAQSANRRIYELTYNVVGDEIALAPYLTPGGGVAATAEEYLQITHVSLKVAFNASDIETTVDDELALFRNGLLASAAAAAMAISNGGVSIGPITVYSVTKTVKPDGTGDFTHPALAIAAITDASYAKRYRILIYPGVYDGQAEWHTKDYVDLTGTDRGRCIIQYALPNNATNAAITNTSTFWLDSITEIANLTVTARNMRYAIHLETNGLRPGTVQKITNCHIEHFGNASAVNNPWPVGSQIAVGSGLSSGQVVIGRGSMFRSPGAGFSYHTNAAFNAATVVDMEGCQFVSTVDSSPCIRIQPAGSQQGDVCRLAGNVYAGDIQYGVGPTAGAPWLLTALVDQPANHNEVRLYIYGGSPVLVRNIGLGSALKIQSGSTGAASSVTVAGDAVPLIFGDSVTAKFGSVTVGSAGFKGSVTGWGDISGMGVGAAASVITRLGQRLGDCSTVNRMLSVTVDGAAPINITFNANHTGQSNATILAIINAALGSAAVASEDLVDVRYRPRIAEDEIEPRNSTATGIPTGTVLAFDTSDRTVRPMTSADSGSRLAGTAMQDIPAGETGRVKRRGYLALADLLRTDNAAIAFGDTFSIDAASPGRIVKGGAQGLLSAIRTDAVKLA